MQRKPHPADAVDGMNCFLRAGILVINSRLSNVVLPLQVHCTPPSITLALYPIQSYRWLTSIRLFTLHARLISTHHFPFSSNIGFSSLNLRTAFPLPLYPSS